MATKEKFSGEEPAMGIPYHYAVPPTAAPPHMAGTIPANAIYGDPKGIPLHQTMFMDTPAPFNCVYCGSSGLTTVRFMLNVTFELIICIQIIFLFG